MLEIFFEVAADEAMAALEAEPDNAELVQAIWDVLLRLAANPGDPKLGSRVFQVAELAHARITPVPGSADWRMIWQVRDGALVVILPKRIA